MTTLQQPRYGFTTGSCAAAAAKAAVQMLLTGDEVKTVTIPTPKGIPFTAEIKEIHRNEGKVSCGVVKDGGDDPDVTTGLLICVEVTYGVPGDGKANDTENLSAANETETGRVRIDGGEGVGRVTRPGLDQPVGAAAINHVPREMIANAVEDVLDEAGYEGTVSVTVFVPGGEAVAARTFNPRLGVAGGISIIGTTGIVEPMSTQAIKDTIFLELRQRREEGADAVIVTPGNYGRDFLQNAYGYDIDKAVKCSNYIGDAIDDCVRLGFTKMLLAGHIGKLVKVAGGIMNTHSKEADCRMELLAAAALRAGAETEVLQGILDCLTTEEALSLLQDAGMLSETMTVLIKRIMEHVNARAKGAIEIECMMYANAFGLLAQSEGAGAWFTS